MSGEKLDLILKELQSVKSQMEHMEVGTKKQFAQLNEKVDGVSEQVAKNAETITDIKDNQKTITTLFLHYNV